MDATQKRRLLVLAVCALGVSALYLVPGVARSPEQLQGQASPTWRPSDRSSTASQRTSGSDGQPVSARYSPAPRRDDRAADPGSGPTGEPRADRVPRYRTARSTPVDPHDTRDRSEPGRPSAVEVREVTADTVTVRWAPAHDDVAVVSYRVSLNGYTVATTTGREATIEFFTDDSVHQVVQVQAVDAAGNTSAASASVLVDRSGSDPAPTSYATADRSSPQPTTAASPDPAPTSSKPITSRPVPEPGATSDAPPDPADPTRTGPDPTARASDSRDHGRSSEPDASGDQE